MAGAGRCSRPRRLRAVTPRTCACNWRVGKHYLVPAAVVIPQPDGSVYVPLRVAELVPAPREAPAEILYAVVPVLAEELEVQKRRVETGKVRLTKVVHEREVQVDEPLWREEVEVTRVPMQRVVDGPVPVREEHGTTILSVVEEVLVVEKRWMLREEIHIRHATHSRRTSHNGSRYAAKRSRWSVSLTLMNIHEGERRMAKTLVALYDTCTDAEQCGARADHGRLCPERYASGSGSHRGSARPSTRPSSGTPPMREHTWWRRSPTLACRHDEAFAYAEGVRRGGALVVVESSDEQAERGMAILQRLHPVDIHARTAQWQQEGWTGADASATTSTPRRARRPRRAAPRSRGVPRTWANQGAATRRVEGDKEVTIPVVEEEISIGTREVERGHVRIDSRVTEQPVEESVRLREEKVTVERRPVDRPATDADFAAAGKEVIEMTETAEEPVVSKRARVVEEVVVQKEVTEHTETVRGTERHTEVDVQREPETATATRRVHGPPGLCDLRHHLPGALHARPLPTVVRRIRRMSPRTAMATS